MGWKRRNLTTESGQKPTDPETRIMKRKKRFVVNEHRPRCLNNSMKRLGSSMINSAPQVEPLSLLCANGNRDWQSSERLIQPFKGSTWSTWRSTWPLATNLSYSYCLLQSHWGDSGVTLEISKKGKADNDKQMQIASIKHHADTDSA